MLRSTTMLMPRPQLTSLLYRAPKRTRLQHNRRFRRRIAALLRLRPITRMRRPARSGSLPRAPKRFQRPQMYTRRSPRSNKRS
jgi:hypothetical protein